ncbi:MAG: glycosyltransferase [Bacteroidales bacterium]|nr:glycosyltransferase family 2 protein [Bacteroidales bacterium]MCR5554773.1 glycosyltransferase [Bacteroidales bacterium]
MLSILIPVYNWDVRSLVAELHKQATNLGIAFEILLLDDASTDERIKEFNQELKLLDNVTLRALPSNAGRAVSRNLLARAAKYKHLLFMDCDSEPVDGKFLERYIPFCQQNPVVVYGGIQYKKIKVKPAYKLRWTYGIVCEERPAKERRKQPNSQFHTFNFLISKDLFMSIQFNEMLKHYGHEDTLFGIELTKKGITVQHIDNPLYHLDINDNQQYIQKTRYGVENLRILLNQYEDKPLLTKEIRLLKYYHVLEKTKMVWVGSMFYHTFNQLMLKNFNGSHPNLTLFNLYKLSYLSSLKFQKEAL